MLKIGIVSGTLFAALAVILGAFGAHALKGQLSEYSQSVYEKAVLYQMFHALGILIVTLIGETVKSVDILLSIWFFIFGIVLFSGSLYILAITNIKWLGMITPIGGTFFIVGWILVFYRSLNI